MHGDYKYAMQMRAEEIAEELYGREYYDLPDSKQMEVFEMGRQCYIEDMASRADRLRDERKDANV